MDLVDHSGVNINTTTTTLKGWRVSLFLSYIYICMYACMYILCVCVCVMLWSSLSQLHYICQYISGVQKRAHALIVRASH